MIIVCTRQKYLKNDDEKIFQLITSECFFTNNNYYKCFVVQICMVIES